MMRPDKPSRPTIWDGIFRRVGLYRPTFDVSLVVEREKLTELEYYATGWYSREAVQALCNEYGCTARLRRWPFGNGGTVVPGGSK